MFDDITGQFTAGMQEEKLERERSLDPLGG